MTAPLRIALIGAGAMGRQHAALIERDPDATLVAIADPFSPALAGERGLPHFVDHRQMLDVVKPDAVIIANPNDRHVTTALDCLAAGVPTLLEKPVACDSAEGAALLEAAAHGSTPVLVGHHRRHHPIIRRARALIAEGALGELITVTALWQLYKPDSYFDVKWRREPGAGVMLINLIHDLDLLRHLCGEVSQVHAFCSHSRRQLPVEDSAVLNLAFESGALATLAGSDAAVSPWGWDQNVAEMAGFAKQQEQPCYLLAGSEGALALPQLRLWRYPGEKSWQQPLASQRDALPEGDAQQHQLAHFIRVARGEAAPLISVEDALRTLAVAEAAGHAARDGHCIAPDYL